MKLPSDYREIAHGAACVVRGKGSSYTAARQRIVDMVCDRAKRLSDDGLIVGDSKEAVASVLYGGWYVWVFIWTNRELIWQVIDLLATLVMESQKETNPLGG